MDEKTEVFQDVLADLKIITSSVEEPSLCLWHMTIITCILSSRLISWASPCASVTSWGGWKTAETSRRIRVVKATKAKSHLENTKLLQQPRHRNLTMIIGWFLSHFSWLFVSLKSGTYFEVMSHMSLVRSENIWRVHRCGDEAAQMQLRSKHEVSGGRNNPSIGKAHLKRLPHVAILRTRQIGFTIDFSQRQLWSNSCHQGWSHRFEIQHVDTLCLVFFF